MTVCFSDELPRVPRGGFAPVPQARALLFPSNVSGSSTASAYGVLQFASPQDNGLPLTGPSNAGITILRRIKPLQQTGYYAQFWYTPVNGTAAPINGEAYYGFHPYPPGGASGTTHQWEVAAKGGDFLTTLGGSAKAVTQNTWFTQAFRVEHNAGSPILTFWIDLPSTANADKISTTGALGTTNHTYQLVIGNSPWMGGFQEERASCHHGQIKIIGAALTEADIVSEAGNMNALVTSAAQGAIWWGKKGFASVNDLACDYGTGRAFTRNDASNIITLGEAL